VHAPYRDPHQRGAVHVVGARAHRQTEARAEEHREAHERERDHDQRDDVVAAEAQRLHGERHVDRRGEALRREVDAEPAGEEEPEPGEHLCESDGRDREHEAGRAEEPPDHDRLDDDAEHDRSGDPGQERDEPAGAAGHHEQDRQRRRCRAEVTLRDSQQRLLETSRLAGMAEVATGVLHNVGNVLNSVNVSAGLVVEKLRRSKVPNLGKAAALLTERNGDLGNFLTNDPNGQKIPGYLAKLSQFLIEDNSELLTEVDLLARNIEHIKEVVAVQQSYAKVSGAFEDLAADQLVEDSIAMNIGAFERHGIVLERRFSPAPPVRVDRHRVLQILINLLRNAKYALDDVQRIDKRITITIAPLDDKILRIAVADNGIGISLENLDRIFGHGFTTRKNGHGFGLHSGALAAKEMGGSLGVQSLGLRRGATFTLELPIAAKPES